MKTKTKHQYIFSESKDYIKIESIETLKHLAIDQKNEQIDAFILLNFGARSSKDIFYYEDGGYWAINHCIDDTHKDYESDEEFIKGEEFFFDAISKNAVWTYNNFK